MTIDDARMIESVLYFSETLKRKGALFFLRHLRDWGGTFLYTGVEDIPYDVESFCAENPDVTRFRLRFESFYFYLSLIPEEFHLVINSSASFVSPEKNEQAATVLLSMIEKIVELLSFKYGYVDTQVEKSPPDKTVSSTKLASVFWTNFFGPDFVAKYGKQFLLNAPGFKTSELSDGTIEYIVSKHLFRPADQNLDQEVTKYFAQKIKVKRHKQVADRW